MTATRERILDVALDLLGANPDAGMGEIGAAAGVVRRTVYGHFPSRADLVLALTRRAVGEIVDALGESTRTFARADVAWADFVTRLWPLVHRYRVLVALRRGEFGAAIHGVLAGVEKALADLVAQGQRQGTFGRHLPPDVLSTVAWSALFTIADAAAAGSEPAARDVVVASLLVLGVPEARARALAQPAATG